MIQEYFNSRVTVYPLLMKMKMNLDYIAGFIDGEGTITINRERRGRKKEAFGVLLPNVSIANTNKEIIEEIKSFFNERGVRSYIITSRKGGIRKDCYRLRFEGHKNLFMLIHLLENKLQIKAEHLNIIKAFLDSRRVHKKYYNEHERNLYRKIKNLNKKGSAATGMIVARGIKNEL